MFLPAHLSSVGVGEGGTTLTLKETSFPMLPQVECRRVLESCPNIFAYTDQCK